MNKGHKTKQGPEKASVTCFTGSYRTMKSVSRFLKPGLGSRRPSSSISKPGIALSTLPSEHFKAGLEEPQSMSAQQGYGYYPGRLGECIGDGEATFRIVRKLGWGSYSNVWLGQDTRSFPIHCLPYISEQLVTCICTEEETLSWR